MKANELRIGNLVLDKGDNIFAIAGILGNSVLKEDAYIGMPLEWTKPIPLTEDWLLKFGYEKIIVPTAIKDLSIVYYKKLNFVVYLLSNSFEVELITKSGEQFNLYKNFKKEIHILQNLYFALNGEEL